MGKHGVIVQSTVRFMLYSIHRNLNSNLSASVEGILNDTISFQKKYVVLLLTL